ncbi:MAG: 50S ribosomal protein L24 [Acidobacteriales bacterium]|nr:50S ribosomal protein L24 [Terriglobales bacterium]
MQTRVDIRKDDTVKIITGRGKTIKEGRRVLAVFPTENKVLVEGVKLVKKHVRKNPTKQIKGGIAEQEARIHISNVMIVCPGCHKPTRVGRKDGVRICKRCNDSLDK